MPRRFSVFACSSFLACAGLAGLLVQACASPPPPEPVSPEPPAPSAAPVEKPQAEPEPPPAAEPPAEIPQKKAAAEQAGYVPDDYYLTSRDCLELGRKLALVMQSDERAKLDAKLKEKQREQAEAAIDKEAARREQEWVSGCESSLVGKVGDRAALKCAMGSKTVKAFDECLNGPAAPAPGKGNKP